MVTFFNLIGGIKGIVVIALILAASGWIYNQKRTLEKVELERDQAIVLRNQAGIERDKAIQAAQTNLQTISRLEEERDLANKSLNSLSKAKNNNSEKAVAREIIIERESKVPANAAPAAPVLGTIIAEIQTDRLRRRGNTE